MQDMQTSQAAGAASEAQSSQHQQGGLSLLPCIGILSRHVALSDAVLGMNTRKFCIMDCPRGIPGQHVSVLQQLLGSCVGGCCRPACESSRGASSGCFFCSACTGSRAVGPRAISAAPRYVEKLECRPYLLMIAPATTLKPPQPMAPHIRCLP